MNTEKRKEIISNEIDKAIKTLTEETWMSAYGCTSDLFELPDGRIAQIKMIITVESENEELDEPTNSFND